MDLLQAERTERNKRWRKYKPDTRHYLAVTQGTWEVRMRWALHGYPAAPATGSTVGMTRSNKKRKARELAFYRATKNFRDSVQPDGRIDGPHLCYPEALAIARREYGLTTPAPR